ncbi:uncharacterized protein KY384_005737 [Bacidia gigantensis]|uniref:uncharacterized protein n=1 Tax=Bacidia gigantensis TaxID=2732470 RepID=UPI001D05952E|nr:uncharacterized protein KY384_005737 [Bacidia gigantensis]KAG8529102.1 hypothetical protein KY384_005737 [Bacidia gigantensis]
MSRDVQLQSDVGGLSLQGVRAASSILAILSADNVAPLALIQLENLGAMFFTSGEYAEKVKTLLHRCSDVRLEHLSMAVGWRKNDTASLMAQSAGGQAVALISLCLTSLFRNSDTGMILSRLCAELLPKSANLASMQQLADVASCLGAKLATLGFGNLLARQIMAIHDVYESNDIACPRNLLEPLNIDLMMHLLNAISRALREDRKICRVSGTRGMGHILGLVHASFRHNTKITVEGVIVQDAESTSIVCEVSASQPKDLVEIHLETSMLEAEEMNLPIGRFHEAGQQLGWEMSYRLTWAGCLADRLQLLMFEHGFTCDQELLDACGDCLMWTVSEIEVEQIGPNSGRLVKPMLLQDLLGPFPRSRLRAICKTVLRAEPTAYSVDKDTAFHNLSRVLSHKTHGCHCVCSEDLKCGWNKSWSSILRPKEKRKRCTLHLLWQIVGLILSKGVLCSFIDAGPNVTVESSNYYGSKMIDMLFYNRVSIGDLMLYIQCGLLGRNFGPLVAYEAPDIALSSGASTVYPTILETLSVPSRQAVTFTVVDGQLIFNGRYNKGLVSDRVEPRSTANSLQTTGDLKPSNLGVHLGSPLITIRETFHNLELLCSFKFAGQEIKVRLGAVIEGYMGMKWSDTCPHPAMNVIDQAKYPSKATSVANPYTHGYFGVAMTKGSPAAQFLCCGRGYQTVLVHDSCLNCAAEGVKGHDYVVLITT